LKSYLSDGTGFVVLPDDFYMLTYFKMSGWKKPVMDAYILNERTSVIQSNAYTRGSQISPVAVIEPVAAIDYIDVTNISKYWQSNTPANPAEGEVWYNPSTELLQSYLPEPVGWSPSIPVVGQKYKFVSVVGIVETWTYYTITDVGEDDKVTFEVYDPYSDIKQALRYYSLRKGLQSHTIEEAIYVPVAQPLSAIDDDTELELDHRLLEPMAYLSASSVFTIFEKYDIAKALEQRVIDMFPAFRSVKGSNITFKQ